MHANTRGNILARINERMQHIRRAAREIAERRAAEGGDVSDSGGPSDSHKYEVKKNKPSVGLERSAVGTAPDGDSSMRAEVRDEFERQVNEYKRKEARERSNELNRKISRIFSEIVSLKKEKFIEYCTNLTNPTNPLIEDLNPQEHLFVLEELQEKILSNMGPGQPLYECYKPRFLGVGAPKWGEIYVSQTFYDGMAILSSKIEELQTEIQRREESGTRSRPSAFIGGGAARHPATGTTFAPTAYGAPGMGDATATSPRRAPGGRFF